MLYPKYYSANNISFYSYVINISKTGIDNLYVFLEGAMDKNYSISKIIKNKIGYFSTVLFFTGIIVFIVSLIFINDLKIKTTLLLYSIATILIILVLLIKYIIKIIYFFKYGIETRALVIDDYCSLGNRWHSYESLSSINEMRSSYNNNTAYRKVGVIYRYNIGLETYESKYCFVINGDTMFFKEGSVINILVNPKNKNNTIIKDIFVK
jgi:hypothetical protein